MKPLISIIIPAYNAADHIADCIQSVFSQTYSNWEAIIIDDGSEDETRKFAVGFSKQDRRVRVLTQCNQGVSAARNYGLDQTKGEYIVFLDSDDMMHPDFLRKSMKRLLEKQADIISCEYIRIESEKMRAEYDSLISESSEENWKSAAGEEALECFHRTETPYLRIAACKLIRKEVIGKLRFERGIVLGEDTLFMYELMLKGVRLEQTDAPWYYYRMHEKSAVHNWNHMKKKNPYHVFLRIRDAELKYGRYDYARIWEDSYLAILVNKYKLAKDNKQRMVCVNLRKEADKAMLYRGFSRSRIMYFLYFHCEPVQKICADIINCIREGEKIKDARDVSISD